MLVLGIDPGLTRCGWGLIESNEKGMRLLSYGVWQTSAQAEIGSRLSAIADSFLEKLVEVSPEHIALERLFAQHNLRTVMGVAQISGVILRELDARKIPVSLHTPSEVKAAITGYGNANKTQVAEMVKRTLNLEEVPSPADAADAIALAITAARRLGRLRPSKTQSTLTKAQETWLAAESKSKGRR